MPIVYPARVVEKIREVIKEVIKVVGLSPSVSIGMEMTLEPGLPMPEVITAFGLGLSLRLWSLYNFTTPIGPFLLVQNPTMPLPSTIYGFGSDSGWNSLSNPLVSQPTEEIITNPSLPSVTVISSFSPSVYGAIEMGSKPDLSHSMVSAPSRPTPSEVREFSTSVGVRKSP